MSNSKKLVNLNTTSLQSLLNNATRDKAKNIAASRKSRARKLFKDDNGVVNIKDYTAHIAENYGVTIKVFESIEFNNNNSNQRNATPTKGSNEWHEYNRRATRRSKMKKLLAIVEIIDVSVTTLDQFVIKYTECTDTDQFLSDAYNHSTPGCYTLAKYPKLVTLVNNASKA